MTQGWLCALLAAAGLGAPSESLDGVWRSVGWGLVLEIQGASLQAYEVTSATCVKSFSGKRTAGDGSFRGRDGTVFRVEADSGRGQLRQGEPLASIAIERVDSLPAVCTPPTPNTPLGNFDVFARTFAEHYISFDRRGVDWERTVAGSRARIDPSTTDTQLFDILADMIRPLSDIHTGIDAAPIKRSFEASLRPGTIREDIERFADRGRRELASIINEKYVRGRLRSFCRGQWKYGALGDGIGYLRILSFGNCPDLDRALDRIFRNAALRALVIDLRLSFGGDDRIGLAIASRMTNTAYAAYAIAARSDAADRSRYTAAQSVTVQASARPFAGPVVQLTGPVTMSAAETFVQALMGRMPRVTRIGESTQGVFCDALERRLPNGWSFALPNAVYRTSDGRAFDVHGIPPDVAVPVFSEADVAARRDSAMEAALKLLAPNSSVAPSNRLRP